MSKELEALETIKQWYSVEKVNTLKPYQWKQIRDLLPKECEIIETALKEKEQQDGVIQILKEIIEFSQVLPRIEPNKDNGFDIMSAVSINIQRDIENKERELLRKWILETCFPKELKALEIIKRGFRDDGKYGENFDYIDLEEGSLCIDGRMYLYDGECDLLKEVLCSNSADKDMINNTFGLD